MTGTVTKVAYKPDVKSTSQYVVVGVHPEQLKKWKDGDTTIPLVEVVDSFEVFHSNTGPQGILGKASNQQMETDFGTKKAEEVVKIILEKGKLQVGDGINSTGQHTTNATRGSARGGEGKH